MPALGEKGETRLAVAALAAVIVRGAEDALPGLSRRVVQELESLHHELRYLPICSTTTIETLRWTRELIKGRFVAPL